MHCDSTVTVSHVDDRARQNGKAKSPVCSEGTRAAGATSAVVSLNYAVGFPPATEKVVNDSLSNQLLSYM